MDILKLDLKLAREHDLSRQEVILLALLKAQLAITQRAVRPQPLLTAWFPVTVDELVALAPFAPARMDTLYRQLARLRDCHLLLFRSRQHRLYVRFLSPCEQAARRVVEQQEKVACAGTDEEDV